MNKEQFRKILTLRNEVHQASYIIAKEAIHHRVNLDMVEQLRGASEALIALAEELHGTEG